MLDGRPPPLKNASAAADGGGAGADVADVSGLPPWAGPLAARIADHGSEDEAGALEWAWREELVPPASDARCFYTPVQCTMSCVQWAAGEKCAVSLLPRPGRPARGR